MDNRNQHRRGFRKVFYTSAVVVLSLLLGLQAYTIVVGPRTASQQQDLTDNVVLQLRIRVTEVNRKQCKEILQSVIENVTLAFSSGRAKNALKPCRALLRHIADYALETKGARIVDTGGTLSPIRWTLPMARWALHVAYAALCPKCPGASSIKVPTLPEELALRFRGEATIRLRGTVRVHGVSLEHIPPHISPTGGISSSARFFQLEGLKFQGDPYPHDFGTFKYDKDKKQLLDCQYFKVLHPSKKGFNLVRFKVNTESSHNSVYTCVYRVRVHGDLVSDQSRHTDSAAKDDGSRMDNE